MSGKKSDLNFNIYGDERKAIESMAKVVQKQEESINKLKKANKEAKSTTNQMEKMRSPLKGAAQDIGKMAVGFVSAQSAIGVAKGALDGLRASYEDLVRKQKESAKLLEDNSREAAKAIAGWGGAEMIDETKKSLKKIEVDATMKEKVHAFGGYVGAHQDASKTQAVESTRLAVQSKHFHEPVEFAKTMGYMGKLNKNLSPDDVADQAHYMMMSAGDKSSQFPEAAKEINKLISIGIDPVTAKAMAITSIQEDQGQEALGTIGRFVTKDFKNVSAKPGEVLTGKQRVQNELAGMSQKERLDWLFSGSKDVKEELGTEYAQMAPILESDKLEQHKKGLREAQTGDIFTSDIGKFKKTDTAKYLMTPDKAAALKEEVQSQNREGAIIEQSSELAQGIYESDKHLNWAERTRHNIGSWVERTIDPIGYLKRERDHMKLKAKEYRSKTSSAEWQPRQPPLTETFLMGPQTYGVPMAPPSTYDPEMAESYQKGANEISRTIQLLENINKNTERQAEAAEKQAEEVRKTREPEYPPIVTGGAQ
ncbi:hypothetical protein [Sedimentisphaera salicampi]|uniref:hypothetical protein n=1 Tax=Sedimentisphaera salicampi TaxID=1941349 RepID=UPI000B9B98AA|nr:hypothetical protein [Sedimentisphaera salicampi]OXU15408.1 hypothetical protein SMSP1_00889 [Sedimentisphaera salicampi]